MNEFKYFESIFIDIYKDILIVDYPTVITPENGVNREFSKFTLKALDKYLRLSNLTRIKKIISEKNVN